MSTPADLECVYAVYAKHSCQCTCDRLAHSGQFRFKRGSMQNRQMSLSRRAAGLVVLAILVLTLGTNLDIGKAQTAKGGDQLIPIIAPGSAYRQVNLLSDVPGL